MKKILLFNHKGGVSKTTSTFHIGWMLAEMGHKVLLVDADPQCNLTSLFLGDSFDEYYENKATSESNIMDGVKNAYYGVPQPIEAFDCPNNPMNRNLYLLPGHMNLSEYDIQLNFAFSASTAMQSIRSLPGAFNDLIEKCAYKLGADYIFIDLNPGLSAINQDMFLICDAFIIPTNPDTFSLMSIRSLSTILPKWVRWKNENINLFKTSAYPLPEGTPKFIGEIPQRFNIRNGKATSAYRTKISEISTVVVDEFIPKLKEANMLYSEEDYKRGCIDTNNFILQEIKDFQGLSPKSLNVNVPVYKLTDEQLKTTGSVLAAQKQNILEFYAVYADIASKIVKILNDDRG